MIFAGIGLGLSWLLHGCPFDQNMDALMVFFVGVSISLFAGAIFFPLFYLCGEERSGAFLVISLLCAIGIVMGIITFINITFGPKMTTVQILLGAMMMLACSLTVFALSYPVTTAIFKRKEYWAAQRKHERFYTCPQPPWRGSGLRSSHRSSGGQGDAYASPRPLVPLFHLLKPLILKASGRIRTGDLCVTNAYAVYDIFLVCCLYWSCK